MARQLQADGHYLGPHSYDHLLYCDWNRRDSLLVSEAQFASDLAKNYETMAGNGILPEPNRFFLPPYEWYNDSISSWAAARGVQLINFSPGTRSNADYTWPELANYRSSDQIMSDILRVARHAPSGLNGHLLLLHLGTDARRKDKFYLKLNRLISRLRRLGYQFVRVDQLLQNQPSGAGK